MGFDHLKQRIVFALDSEQFDGRLPVLRAAGCEVSVARQVTE
jgi:hypothetical protein